MGVVGINEEVSHNCRRSVIIDSLERLEPEMKKVFSFYGARVKEPLSKTYKEVLALSLIAQSPAMLTFRNKVDYKAAVSQLGTIVNQLNLLQITSLERPEMFEQSSIDFIDSKTSYLKDCINMLIQSTDYVTV